MPIELKINDISKRYGNKHHVVSALTKINLTVQSEEFVCIIGPNGCGKSTLLKIIAGINVASSGSISMTNGAAYLPQQPSLLPWRTVMSNLGLPADIRNEAKNNRAQDIKRWLSDFGLMEFASMYPHALSGGMQQKVALIRSVLSNSSLLLLDEPFAALDAITRLELQKWLLDLKKVTHSSIICVTHDIHEALFLADTIYVLSSRPGQIKKRFSHVAQHSKSVTYRNRISKELRELLVNES